MGIRNLHFYNSNETRWYPLSDSADPVNQAGVLLPSGILADLKLHYPEYLGRYPFLASVCVTPTLVSITIQAAQDADDTTGFAPVAVVSIPQPVTPFIHYPVQSQVPGVGGWVVFGNGIQEPYTGRFNGPAASLLSPRAARAYRPFPVTSLAKASMTPLTGLVTLRAEQPLQLTKEQREIEGVLRDVVVFSLTQPSGDANVLAGTNEVNVFQEFAGPCGNRPESGTCGDPQPMQSLNTVQPDCNGNITIQFTGCATISQVEEACGVVVDCGLSLADACLPDTLPSETGRLRTDYPNQCASSQNSESASEGPTPPPSSEPIHDSEPSPPPITGSLPYNDNFSDSADAAIDWVTISGQWAFHENAYSTETPEGPTRRNIALWEGFDHEPLGRRYTTEFTIASGLVSAQHNAAMVLNYKPHPVLPGQFVYYLVELDYDAQQFRILWFNGTNFVAEPAFADLTNLVLDGKYQLVVDVTPGTGVSVNISAQLTAVTGPYELSVSLSLATNLYLPAVGYCGLHANRGYARFDFFDVEEI
jgi:hypothetical protein